MEPVLPVSSGGNTNSQAADVGASPPADGAAAQALIQVPPAMIPARLLANCPAIDAVIAQDLANLKAVIDSLPPDSDEGESEDAMEVSGETDPKPQEPSDSDSDSDEGFQLAKKRPRRNSTPDSTLPSNNFAMANYYEPLTPPSYAQTVQNEVKPQSDDKVEFVNTPPPPSGKIPPIIVRDKARWMEISARLRTARANWTQVQNSREGVRISPATATDYRAIVRILEELKYEFFTYTLRQDKPLRAVIRNIPHEIDLKYVTEELTASGLKPTHIHQMRKTRGRGPMPMILVTLPKTEESKKIFQLKKLCDFKVTVENPRKNRVEITQCFRCQRFGHTQRQCRLAPRCVRCAGDHTASQCTKPRDAEAKCCNCDGKHPASFRGCPACPQKPQADLPPTLPRQAVPNISSFPALKSKPPALPRTSQSHAGASSIAPAARSSTSAAAPPKSPAPPKPTTKRPTPTMAKPRANPAPVRPPKAALKPSKPKATPSRPPASTTPGPPKPKKVVVSSQAQSSGPSTADSIGHEATAQRQIQEVGQTIASAIAPSMRNKISPQSLTALLTLVFKIGNGMSTANSIEEAFQVILGFTTEICELFNTINGRTP